MATYKASAKRIKFNPTRDSKKWDIAVILRMLVTFGIGLLVTLAIVFLIEPLRNGVIDFVAILINAFVLSNIFVCNLIFIGFLVILILGSIYTFTKI